MKTLEKRISHVALSGLLAPSNRPLNESLRRYVPHFLQ